jgi:hypothetical protein
MHKINLLCRKIKIIPGSLKKLNNASIFSFFEKISILFNIHSSKKLLFPFFCVISFRAALKEKKSRKKKKKKKK